MRHTGNEREERKNKLKKKNKLKDKRKEQIIQVNEKKEAKK